MQSWISVTLTSVVTCCSPLHEYPTLYISLLSLSSVFGIRTFFVAVQWLALLPQRQKVLGSNTLASQMEASVWSLCILLVPVWVLSSFFPQSKNIHASLIGDSKLTTGVDITA